MLIECSSVISRVVVHARGALVTREVALPDDLPAGVVDVAVGGITLQAQPGSARASLEGSDRTVTSVHAAVVVPSGERREGPTLARVRSLTASHTRVSEELRTLVDRRKRLVETTLALRVWPRDGRGRERDAFDVRFGDALRISSLLKDKVAELDDRILRLGKELRDLSRELEAAKLEDAQASSRERMGDARPTQTITTRLAGGGRPGRLRITYAVAAARWWPTYTLRVEDAGARATWSFDAIVAQRTGEDWPAVALALSSADLVYDARLPELPSLRFGRAQPPKRRLFRPPPAGVDEMFSAYLAFGGRAFSTPESPPPLAFAAPAMPDAWDDAAPPEEDTAVYDMPVQAAKPSRSRRAVDGGPPPVRRPAPPPPPPMAFAPPPGAAPRMEAVAAPARAAPGLAGAMAALVATSAEAPADAFAAPQEPEVVPSEAWEDHDRLVLAGADEPRRGRLVPRRDERVEAEVARAIADVNAAADGRYTDPLESRGMFDHRYEASGRADVPSDGRVHRVGVASSACAVRMTFRTVPSEAPEVYREAQVVNPFDTALLGGPVDVHLDGSLLVTTTIDRVDRGGALFLGMGVEDRLKVARNVRAAEESAGLLGGSIAVTHTVDIELSSTLADRVVVTVLERVPVSDDKAIEVKLLRSEPPHEPYDQADRGAPVRGGCRWEVDVEPRKKTSVALSYRIVFPQKLDIVGGSRRG